MGSDTLKSLVCGRGILVLQSITYVANVHGYRNFGRYNGKYNYIAR